MKLTGGITEKGLVVSLIFLEAVFGVIALMLFKP